MKLSQSVGVRILATLVFALAFAPHLHAAVTNVTWYRLGENDPGAASGVTATNTVNLLGFNPLKPIGTPRYTNAVSPSAANGLGSSLAVHFSGTNHCFTNALISIATDNFGVEAWVRPNTTNAGSYFIAQNGLIGLGAWDIRHGGGSYFGVLAPTNGVSSVGDGTAIASPGVWAHVAMVRNNGTNRFYFNGVANGPPTTNAPGPPVGHFTIGANFGTNMLGLQNNSFFNGVIDEVRVFTFAPGQFSTNDLLFHALRAATLPATDVNFPNATLKGRAHPVGFPTSVWIEWGTMTNYGNITPQRALAANGGTTNLSETINSAFGGFTYHFRVVASNSLEVVYGADQSFIVPLFSDIGAGLPGVDSSPILSASSTPPGASGFAGWGDYDNDGRLDIVLHAGGVNPGDVNSGVWRNTGTGFTNIAGLVYLDLGSVAWGDIDNDGRLDLVLTGRDISSSPRIVFRRNTSTGFTNFANFNPPGFFDGAFAGSTALGDYDHDGRLDLLLTGTRSLFGGLTSIVWQNTGNGFVENAPGVPGGFHGAGVWGDYDNDGRLDILQTGTTLGGAGDAFSQIWRNTGNGFTNINAGLTSVFRSSAAWGDYDNDGRLDILLTGSTNFGGIGPHSEIWRNTGSGFTQLNESLTGVSLGSAAWGDYDNDGRLDILLIGTTNGTASGAISQIWRNTSGGFSNINAGLPGVFQSSAAWGDYDNDGRLDILLAGSNAVSGKITQVWRNQTPFTNTPPTAPSVLSVSHTGTTVTLSWNSSGDAQTPASALTYNVRIGTTPGASDVMGPMASSSGLRRLPQIGNAQERLFATFHATLGTGYYWSVQAIDTAFAGSPFAAESNFKLLQLPQPVPVLVPATVTNLLNGDLNGDAVVDENELQILLSDYFVSSPFLYMTNVAGLGGTNVTFALTNSLACAFSVEYTTNLVDWYFLGPATPRYLFNDTNAPVVPQRYYRLRWP